MISASGAMLRKLREFVDHILMGTVSWQSVKILRCGRTEEDDEERVDIRFRVGEESCAITLWSPETAPPLGKIECRIGSDMITGQLYSDIWERVAHKVRSITTEDLHV